MPKQLSTYEFTDQAALEAQLPAHAGSDDAAVIFEWIKKTEGKLLPNFIMQKFTALSSGLAVRRTDNVDVHVDKCSGGLAPPGTYQCGPANNCSPEDLPLQKTTVHKDKTLSKSLTYDPVCDDSTLVDLTASGNAVTYAMEKLKGVAYSFAKAENKAIFDYVGDQRGVLEGLTPQELSDNWNITNWDADNAVSQFNCLINNLADEHEFDPTELIVFGQHTLMTAPRVAGAQYDNSGMHSSFRDNYGLQSGAYQFDFQGVPFFADNNFAPGKLFIGERGCFTYWDSPMYYSNPSTGCNHALSHLWSKKYGIYVPCNKKPRFAVIDITPTDC